MVDEASPVPPPPLPTCPMAVENVEIVDVTFSYVIIPLLISPAKVEDSPLTVEASCDTYVTKEDMVDEASPLPVPPPPGPTCPIALEKDDMASYINEENGLLNVEIFVLSEEFKFIRLPKNVDIEDDELPLPPVLNGKAIPLIDDTVKLDVVNIND